MTVSATPSKFILYQSNTQVLQVVGLQDNLTGNYLNAATVVGTLQDQNGNNITECTNITFAYVAASNGNYNGVFGDVNFLPPVGTGYTLLIDGNQSGSYIHLELMVEIQARQS
jgi:hypothetical protein